MKLHDKSLPKCSEDYSADIIAYATQKPNEKSDEYTTEYKFFDFNGNCVERLVLTHNGEQF